MWSSTAYYKITGKLYTVAVFTEYKNL